MSASTLDRAALVILRVSAKDFRLPLGDTPMPSELQPIVARLSETLDQLKKAIRAATIDLYATTSLNKQVVWTMDWWRSGRPARTHARRTPQHAERG